MRRALVLSAVLLAAPLAAQQADEAPGFFSRLFSTDDAASDVQQGTLLERLIQDQLSDASRTVSVEGFTGALSGAATLERLTISDANGIWFTLEDAQLDWNRAALFAGRLEITEFSAARIDLPRLPEMGDAPPTPEASSGFSLPDLPVSIEIGRIGAAAVTIGEPVFGTEANVSIDGGVSLVGGEGAANLAIARRDGQGALTVEAAYDNATQNLALDLGLQENANGIFANLIGLPGTPSVDFSVQSDAPLSDFTANIRLATDGAERLSGTMTLNEIENGRRITTDIGGDIAPVVAPDYRPFFGEAITLRADARILENGAISVPEFALTADALTLNGAVELTDGMPQVIDVSGQIAAESGAPVLLPLGGTETRVDRADLQISFNAAQSRDWTGEINLTGLDRADLSANRISLDAAGRISGDEQITARLRFDTDGLSTGDAGIDAAFGPTLTGRANVDWNGGPVRITRLTLDANALSLTGDAEVTTPETGLQVAGDLALSASDIAVFSTLAGRTLSGSAELQTSFRIAPIANTFDIRALGETRDLTVDEPRADAILAGNAQLDLQATRDEAGLRTKLRRLASDAATITASADLKSGGSTVNLAAELNDTSLVIDALSGPSRITFDGVEDNNRDWTIDTTLTGPGFSSALDGRLTDLYDVPVFTGDVGLNARDLSVFSDLANRQLGGGISFDANGTLSADLSDVALRSNILGADLSIDHPQADILLAGTTRARIEASKTDNTISVSALDLSSDLVEARGSGQFAGPDTEAIFEARLADTAPFADGLSGPLAFSGALGREDSSGQRDLKTELQGETYGAAINGTLIDIFGTPAFDGTVAANFQNLATFAALAERPLKGQLSLDSTVKLNSEMTDIALDAALNGTELAIGQADADKLLAGTLTATLDAAQINDTVTINDLSLSTNLLNATASGQLADETDEITFDARLADIASFVDGFSGPVALAGRLGRANDNLDLDVSATGPGGARADLQGSIAEDLSTANLTTNGAVPLGLANRFIQPRSITGIAAFDLALDGAPDIGNLSGRITTNGTRVSLPTLNAALEGISGAVDLSGGTARLDLGGNFREGGRLAVSGPIGLTAPNSAGLQINLSRINLSDPRLYETSIDGTIRLDGPVAGGARISGRLGLGETNIRIPDSSIGGAGAVPEIVHINEPPPVRGTRKRAGLLDTSGPDDGESKSTRSAFPLDLTINAPNRVFVRGRGLDSEFGGNLRLTGTTANVVPLGAFQLIRGRLDILGQRLALERARITMSGDFTPFLELRASTDVDEFRINIDVEGEADSPGITFSSAPELPQEEVLSRLIFGRGLETISPLQAARLALAVRTLAGQGGEGVVGRIRGDTGLADLDVTTDDDGNAAVRAGAYLGENVYSDVTVNSEGETELNLNLDITPSLTARGGVNSEGNTSLGIFFERDY